jgi:DNA-directed RNA polymerase beta subunit
VKTPDYRFSKVSRQVAEEYNKNADRKVIYDRFPEYVAADRLRPINMNRDEYKVTFTVRIRLIKKTILMVGSKMTNSYGGKGVISTIKPDELMPIMVDKNTGKQYRVEIIMNPYSTINRKIAGVLMEQSLGNCIHRIYDLVEEYKRTKTGQKKIKPLLEKYYPKRFTDLSVEEIIKLHETKPIEEVYYLEVGCFSKFTPEIVEQWMEDLGVESQSEILMPESELSDLEELRENLSPEEYEKIRSSMTGKFRPVDKKLQCGWMTMEELYHIPSYSNKVTTSMAGVGGDISAKRDEPILGKGRYRVTGQMIGEDELSALLSRNARDFIQATRKDTAKEDNQTFLNNLLALGLTISDDEGFNQGGSSLKNDLKTMKTKFRLKNQGKQNG